MQCVFIRPFQFRGAAQVTSNIGEGVVRNEENKNLNPTGLVGTTKGQITKPLEELALAKPDLRKTGTRTPWRIQGYPRTSALEFAHRHLYDQLPTASVLPSGCAWQWLASLLPQSTSSTPSLEFVNCQLLTYGNLQTHSVWPAWSYVQEFKVLR